MKIKEFIKKHKIELIKITVATIALIFVICLTVSKKCNYASAETENKVAENDISYGYLYPNPIPDKYFQIDWGQDNFISVFSPYNFNEITIHNMVYPMNIVNFTTNGQGVTISYITSARIAVQKVSSNGEVVTYILVTVNTGYKSVQTVATAQPQIQRITTNTILYRFALPTNPSYNDTANMFMYNIYKSDIADYLLLGATVQIGKFGLNQGQETQAVSIDYPADQPALMWSTLLWTANLPLTELQQIWSLGWNEGQSSGYESGYNTGYNIGYNKGLSQTAYANPISYFLEPVQTFLDLHFFGEISIGQVFSIALFVLIALMFIKLFAGG